MTTAIHTVNLATETQAALDEVNIGICDVTHVTFYNSNLLQMQRCSYDAFDRLAQFINYQRSPDGENQRLIQPDLRIHFKGGYLERATEEDNIDGWMSCGPGYSLKNYMPTEGTILAEFIKY